MYRIVSQFGLDRTLSFFLVSSQCFSQFLLYCNDKRCVSLRFALYLIDLQPKTRLSGRTPAPNQATDAVLQLRRTATRNLFWHRAQNKQSK